MKLFESHVGDRQLFRRLADVRQHVVSLKEVRAKIEAARADFVETHWDGSSLRVKQVKNKLFSIFTVELSKLDVRCR